MTKNSLNPRNDSTLSRISLWIKNKDNNTWNMPPMPEALFTQEDFSNWQIVCDALEEMTKPIEKSQARAYIQSFAAAFHFAFGGKEDRDLAIANWNAELVHYPEWAVRRALAKLRNTYTAEKPLTPAAAVKILDIYTKDFYKMRDRMRRITQDARIFETEEAREQYKLERKNGTI